MKRRMRRNLVVGFLILLPAAPEAVDAGALSRCFVPVVLPPDQNVDAIVLRALSLRCPSFEPSGSRDLGLRCAGAPINC